MKLAWATDIHVDFLDDEDRSRFCQEIVAAEPDGVLLAGDIANARVLTSVLRDMQRWIDRPLWFVLGNHDFYGSSVAAVRDEVTRFSQERRAVWLGAVGVVELSPRTGLVGHDGWGDARFGAPDTSPVILNDFRHIADLAGLDRDRRAEVLRRLGDESAAHLRRVLPPALDRFEEVLVLTHVPPFREAYWHEGEISNDDFLPYFACRATGEALVEAASAWPDRQLTVLCGHTHSSGECQPLANLRVVTGAAEYTRPALQPLLAV